MQHLIKAGSFKRFVDRSGAYFVGLAFISLLIALYYALIKSPPDYQQGETVRIMYIHVPSAWLALGIYFGIAMSSLSYLVWRNPLSAIFIKSLIPIGMSFCLICLITGMLWGRPIWGVYWVWDARLTSVLILFFLYIGLYILGNSISDKARSVKAIAIVAILGSVNLPIIRFSVKWWNTLHQPASIMRMDKPAIHSDILIPLLTTFIAMLLVTFSIFIYKASAEILESKTRRIISL
jgi:heme exporter protein C